MVDSSTVSPDARVLTLDAVRWGVGELKKPKIHRHFLAYLFLCRSAAFGDRDDIKPVWNDFAPYIRLESTQAGVLQEKPFYLPIASQNVTDLSTYWLNDNLAGSYAPSSVRNAALRFAIDDRTFRLPSNHGALALKALLGGQPIPAAPVAAYLLRNFAFPSTATTSSDLVTEFAEHFGFTTLADGREAFDALFAPNVNHDGLTPQQAGTVSFEWFEPWSTLASAEDEEVNDV